MNDITLNFLELSAKDFGVTCYRRACRDEQEEHPFEKTHRVFFNTRNADGTTSKQPYWIAVECHKDFLPYQFKASGHPYAARWILCRTFLVGFAKFLEKLAPVVDIDDGLFPRLIVKAKECRNLDDSLDGYQGFICKLEWIPVRRTLGLIVNFHFFADDSLFDPIKKQQYSFSLDANGQSNREFHTIRRNWLMGFVNRFARQFLYSGPGVQEQLGFGGYASLNATVLPQRRYEFRNYNSDLRPYWGAKNYGPYRYVRQPPTFVFVFREHYRDAARVLYSSLAGKKFPEKFSGMKTFFDVEFGSANVLHKVIQNESVSEYERVAAEISAEGHLNPVCLVIHSGQADQYYFLKAIFLRHGMPCQVVETSTIERGKGFQWAIAGIAVQLFSKAGGYPWCVKTKRKDTLIVGLSQFVDIKPDGRERFVAYSIATDASGVFKDIQTLSDHDNEDDYIEALAAGLRAKLKEAASSSADEKPRRIVLHCSFRLKKRAMSVIRDVVARCSTDITDLPRVYVVRINTEHDYFGFDESNAACVPHENSVVKIGFGRYLLWTEGFVAGRSITGRVSSPVFVAFDHMNDGVDAAVERELLEDLCNLAGANWRGFQARSRPVSVLYCDLVGDFIRRLKEYSQENGLSLELPKLEQFVPWFL